MRTDRGASSVRIAAVACRVGAAIVLACGLAGCTPGEKSAAEPLTLGEQTLVVESEPDCADRCVRVDLSWPVVQTAPDAAVARDVEQTLRQWYTAKLYSGESAETPQELAQQLIEKYDGSRWTFTRNWETEFRSAQVWTLKRIDEAHNHMSQPQITWTRLHLNPVSGARIDLSSYFDAAAMDELNTRAEALFREEYWADYAEHSGKTPEQFYELWRFKDNRFVVSRDFRVDMDGVLFHWNRYEIGPGSAGSQTVRMKWEDVADLLREDAPVPQPDNAVPNPA